MRRFASLFYGAVRASINWAWVMAVIALLGLNVAAITSVSVFQVLSRGLETLTGVATIWSSYAADAADLSARARKSEDKARKAQADLDAERAGHRRTRIDLDAERAGHNRTRLALEGERARAHDVDGKLKRSNADLARSKKLDADDRLRTRRLAASLQNRARRMASANVASMFAEALPIVGVAAIVAATGYELEQTCRMMEEMDALLGKPEPTAETTEVCGMAVPDAEQITVAIQDAPFTAWEGARGAVPELPDIPDWATGWSFTAIFGQFGHLWDWVASSG